MKKNIFFFLALVFVCCCNKNSETDDGLSGWYENVKKVLGEDFITPEEISATCRIQYSPQQLIYFMDHPPDYDNIIWCKNNGFMLVAGPPNDMNLLQIRHSMEKTLFCNQYWYTGEWFGKNDWVKPSWLMVRKREVPHSKHKNWMEQKTLVRQPEYIPNVAELAWAVIMYKKVRGVYLLPNYMLRTSSVSDDGHHVEVGKFDEGGLLLTHFSLDYNNRNKLMGIASARPPKN
ncbi:hypothetical protein A2997_02495 [Candidatus Nomurabacteria bacterium RIFCSPLOWO2_01_FULL_36_10b]|uniref:Uncharacterized protein n=1 Tax=Candidatus Nomurabacteria bacterium RIFCSPLOWO2_01_FULL_36_10b TaxID=1801766 RepID=A0A1F6WN80_9BACT|nr:MAG: hypothetical protein A2997_02495 [Candidatus Nomurabacteria bacterium RIFCSPLOWO2_01_FULL_36_10b]